MHSGIALCSKHVTFDCILLHTFVHALYYTFTIYVLLIMRHVFCMSVSVYVPSDFCQRDKCSLCLWCCRRLCQLWELFSWAQMVRTEWSMCWVRFVCVVLFFIPEFALNAWLPLLWSPGEQTTGMIFTGCLCCWRCGLVYLPCCETLYSGKCLIIRM